MVSNFQVNLKKEDDVINETVTNPVEINMIIIICRKTLA